MIDLNMKPRKAEQKWQPEEIVLGIVTAGFWIWITLLIVGAL